MWSWLDSELERLAADGLGRSLMPLSSPHGTQVELAGQTFSNFASNDYLGFANAEVTRQALVDGVTRWGVGAGASRLVSGSSRAHEEAEATLAAYVGQPSALLFSSGYAANVSLLSALPREGDVIFSDALNHASIIDGTRLGRARTIVYPHVDVEALGELLARERTAGQRFIVTESVFSMDGDCAPLEALRALADRYKCLLVVDDAHALGVLGKRGQGLAPTHADVTVGTLGKAFGLWGAFVAGPEILRRWLLHRARGFVFSTAVSPALAYAIHTMTEAVSSAQDGRKRVLAHAQRIAQARTVAGDTSAPATSEPAAAIVSWPVRARAGDDARVAVRLELELRQRGFVVRPMRPPTVPEGTSRLRIVPSAAHEERDVTALLEALQEAEQEVCA